MRLHIRRLPPLSRSCPKTASKTSQRTDSYSSTVSAVYSYIFTKHNWQLSLREVLMRETLCF
jgi:hypothetical protein